MMERILICGADAKFILIKEPQAAFAVCGSTLKFTGRIIEGTSK